MILYEIKLVSLENEELFSYLGTKVVLPPVNVSKKFPQSILYITTIDSGAVKTEDIGLIKDVTKAA